MLTKIKEKISSLLDVNADKIEHSDNPNFGDLSYPCFSIAKEQKKNPVEIAKSISEKLSAQKITGVQQVKPIGPYVNFYLDWEKIGSNILKNPIQKFPKKNKEIMVEFAHPNTHKGFHIGHVRNISIGGALSRILEETGYKVIRANYQGDVGPHIAKCLWGYLNLKKLNLKEPKNPTEKGRWLGKVYSAANNYIEGKEELEQEVKELTLKLYANDPELVKLWKKTKSWSLKYFESIYKNFGVKFDRLYMESEVHNTGVKYTKELLKKDVAKKSEEAVVADLQPQNLGVVVLLTKEGYPLYTAKELGLAELEFSEYKPDKIIHVVAVEQELFFKRLFYLIGKLKPEWKKKSRHLSYEMVSLKEGKMSSRKGTVVLFDDLFEKLKNRGLEEINLRNRNLKNKNKVSEKIAMAALIYDMLKVSNNVKMVFDWESALSLEGNTGPYLLYSYARSRSILRKSKSEPKKINSASLNSPAELSLIKELAKFPETLRNTAELLEPHILANYLFELSQAFNTFYNSTPVLNADSEELVVARLKLVQTFSKIMKRGLNLLGIEALEEM